METNTNANANEIYNIDEIKEIKEEIIELNNLIDKKCLEIYNQNEFIENSIINYMNMMENLILEHHKICKNMFGKK